MSISANSLGVKLLCLVTLFHGRGSTVVRCGGGGGILCGRDTVCNVNNLSWCLLPTVTCGGDVCSHSLLRLKYTFPESLETTGTGRVTQEPALLIKGLLGQVGTTAGRATEN